MAKIFIFRNKDGAPTDQPFLTDNSENLSFCISEAGGVSLESLPQPSLPDVFPDPKKDWSNQELADMFRVHQLLRAANIAVVTDRGVTDEGDPWFVFCHTNGEVFIHLCRFDGNYLLDSPNVQRPLRGADFDELIADFTKQALPTRGSADEAGCRVIKLERGGKVRLHPSTMLAALIWSLFLASDELVLLAPGEPILDDDSLLDFDKLLAVETPGAVDTKSSSEGDTVDLAGALKPDNHSEDHTTPNAPDLLREALSQQQGLVVQNNSVNMGLSAVAIAMGFMSESVLVDSQRKVLESLKGLGFSEHGEDDNRIANMDITDDPESSAILAMLVEFLGLDHSPNKDVADAIMAGEETIHQTQESHLAYPVLMPDAETVSVDVKPIRFELVLDKIVIDEGSDIEMAEPNATERLVESDDGSDVLQDMSSMTLASIVQNLQLRIEEFQLGQTIVNGRFDLSKMYPLVLDTIDTTAAQGLENPWEYDDLATRLINFLEAKDDDIGVIEFNDQLIMVDLTAATGGKTDFIHWEAEDGRTLSFIGLAVDLQAFDMIA